MRIVFMGSSDFGIPALQQLLRKYDVAAVVSTPAQPQGRGLKLTPSPISLFAQEQKLSPILTPADLGDPAFIESLTQAQAELFVVVAFRILPERVFSLPPRGTINIHGSLLPRYRGPAPIQRAIEHGETETGVTIFRIDKGIDTGNVLLQKKCTIGPGESAPEIFSRLSDLGAQALIEAITLIEQGSTAYARQDASAATPAPKLKKSEAHIDWRSSAHDIFNRIRAFKPFPGTFAVLGDRRLNIDWAEPLDTQADQEPGTIVTIDKTGFSVACGRGTLRIRRVKPEGKREMSAEEFLRGARLSTGTRFS
jgi:methionyl-tRNA formyltransferase